jgi:nucleoid-associated protein YgaU
MSDRAQLLGEAPRACPFVAFDDDRDRRSDEPDHRHRCYAEPTPAPRAIAHQAAYCISPGFAACPIFLDWAVRAAAEPVPPSTRPVADERAWGPATQPGVDVGWSASRAGRTTEDRLAPWTPAAGGIHDAEQMSAFPDRAAGPTGDEEMEGILPAGRRREAETRDVAARANGPASAVDRPAATVEPPAPTEGAPRFAGAAPSGVGVPPVADAAAPPARGRFPWSRDASNGDAWPDVDGGHDAEPPPFLAGRHREGDRPKTQSVPSRATAQARPLPTPQRPGRRPVLPAWERPRRFEAYPTLRTRVGLRRIPPVALGAIALVVAAAVLFLLPGFLAGLPGGDAGRSPVPSPTATASPEPTPTPEPTPVSYTVRPGDTLSRIARRFGLTVEQLQCANGITDPNRLAVEQVLVIPDDTFQCPDAASPEP